MNSNTIQESKKAIQGSNALTAALDALTPNPRSTKAERFREVLPAIERALARKVTQKQICEELKQAGLPLSPQTFKSMLSRERQARAAAQVHGSDEPESETPSAHSEPLSNDDSANGFSNLRGRNASDHYAQRHPASR